MEEAQPGSVHLTREQVAQFLDHLHPIPATKGFLQNWLKDHAPGWGSTALRDQLIQCGAIVQSDTHFSRYECAARLLSINIGGSGTGGAFAEVTWNDVDLPTPTPQGFLVGAKEAKRILGIRDQG